MFTSRAEFGTFNAAAVRESRLVTIRPFLLFATERGDAWILDPVDHLASPIAETGVPRTVHIVETENASRSAGEAVKKSSARLSSSGMKSRPNDNDSAFTRRSRSPLGSRRSSADDDAVDGQAGSDAASARPAATVCPRRLLWSVWRRRRRRGSSRYGAGMEPRGPRIVRVRETSRYVRPRVRLILRIVRAVV